MGEASSPKWLAHGNRKGREEERINKRYMIDVGEVDCVLDVRMREGYYE